MSHLVPSVRLFVALVMAAGAGSKERPETPTQLQNAGFESAVLHEGWTVHVYGAQPRLALDRTVSHEGRQALRISSEALSDTAFGQEVKLQPGRWYRLTGWVRTDKLDPHGAPVYGTFQIQHPGGHGVVASGRNHGGTSDWVRETICFTPPGLLQRAGQFIDYICPHHYGCRNLLRMEEDARRCRAMIAAGAPDRDIRLGITEWNTTAGDWGLRRARLWTLENALDCARYHNFMHRHCDAIEIANRSNLADSLCSGVIQTNNHALYKTPTYYVQELYANHAGQTPLAVQIDAVLPADPAVDTSATLSADGAILSVFAVNHTGTTQRRTLDLAALAPLAEAIEVGTILDTLKARERDAANSWREPDRIRTVWEKIMLSRDKLTYQFPPLSVTLLKFRCDRRSRATLRFSPRPTAAVSAARSKVARRPPSACVSTPFRRKPQTACRTSCLRNRRR